jgi:uncharacterized membrane protein
MIAKSYESVAVKEGEGRVSHAANVCGAERWASLLAGAGLTVYGILRRDLPGAALALGGGALVIRGATGRCAFYGALGMSTAADRRDEVEQRLSQHGFKIEKAVTIGAPPHEIYRFWRDFGNLPRVLRHVESVEERGDGVTHWKAKGPFGTEFEWDAEIINERENELIAWRTLGSSLVDHAGSVHFTPLAGGRSEVRVVLKYDPPTGVVGTAIAKLFGQDPEKEIEEDLLRLDRIFETARSVQAAQASTPANPSSAPPARFGP